MNENNFIQKVNESYFEVLTIKLDKLKKILKEVMPVEGYVDAEMIEEDGVMTCILKDYYNENKWDVADFLCKLSINSDGIIQVVEHDMPSYVNDKNKEIVLFLSSLVGKKLSYKAEDNGVIDPLESVLEYLYDETI